MLLLYYSYCGIVLIIHLLVFFQLCRFSGSRALGSGVRFIVQGLVVSSMTRRAARARAMSEEIDRHVLRKCAQGPALLRLNAESTRMYANKNDTQLSAGMNMWVCTQA